MTTRVLYPGQAEVLTFAVTDADVKTGKAKVLATVTATEPECRLDNNASASVLGTCQTGIE